MKYDSNSLDRTPLASFRALHGLRLRSQITAGLVLALAGNMPPSPTYATGVAVIRRARGRAAKKKRERNLTEIAALFLRVLSLFLLRGENWFVTRCFTSAIARQDRAVRST